MEFKDNEEFAFLGIRKKVLFPGHQFRLTIGRQKSKRLAQSFINKKTSFVFIATFVPAKPETDYKFDVIKIPDEVIASEKDLKDNDGNKGIYKRGVLAKIIQISRLKENYSMVVEGIVRAEFKEFTSIVPFYRAKVIIHRRVVSLSDREKALLLNLNKAGTNLANLIRRGSSGKMRTYSKDIIDRARKATGPELADIFAVIVDSKLEERQKILAELELEPRLEFVTELINRHIEIFNLSEKIQNTMEDNLKSSQREYLLRQQLKTIQSELDDLLGKKGESSSEKSDFEELSDKINELVLPDDTRVILQKELARLRTIQPSQPEYNVIKSFLDIAVDLPWNKTTEDNIDILAAKTQLENDHFGLDAVKRRILEFLAVMSLNKESKKKNLGDDVKFTAPILCLAGAPGVGKTSLGKSVAKALGRKFARISLGGVKDEAEIRGHRRTYIGAMPGKLISTFRKCQSMNPVILLDEIDKVSNSPASRQGDVSAALLEVLDPEQNGTFSDHYLGFPFDLSQTLFIATANDLSTIPGPLMDRMEIIDIPSYTTKEKIQIAKSYLIPRQLRQHSLTHLNVSFEESALSALITSYTREAGVRSLERQIAAICRDLAVEELENRGIKSDSESDSAIYESEDETIISQSASIVSKVIDKKMIEKILGVQKYSFDADLHHLRKGQPGVSIGLAYTQFGGDILFIESALYHGTGKTQLTGRLGQVMSESVNAAFTFIKSNTAALLLKQQFENIHTILGKLDLHVHFPSGAVPKDGPSAGVAICASILSALSGRLIRSDTACTGEISLRGKVLPVGGIKEKVLAAHRAGIKRVVLPKTNAKDISEIPEDVRNSIKIITCDTVFEAIGHLFNNDDDLTIKPKWYYDLPDEELGIRDGEVVLKHHSPSNSKLKFDLIGPILRSVL